MIRRNQVNHAIALSICGALISCSGGGAPAGASSASGGKAGAGVNTGTAHKFEGGWVRTDTNGSGSFGGLTSTFEKASLTPEAAAAMAKAPQLTGPPGVAPEETRQHKVGEPYIVVDKPCQGGPLSEGSLGVSPDSGAIHIIESQRQFVIALERGGARTIFTDGRLHPDAGHWTPTAAGHGVGHYENDVFVVDTVGLPTGRVPGEGWRTPETHLIERYELSADGQHMTIHYSYNDPKLYTKPHSFYYTFDRLPADSYAIEEWCDASDPAERQSIVPPPQE